MTFSEKLKYFILAGLQLILANSFAQTATISGVINHYVKVTQLGIGTCVDSIYVTSTASFSADDTVLIIQMKGATIDTTNTAAFGSIISYGNAGNYEIGIIGSVGPGVIVLKNTLARTYSIAGLVQLVRIPQYVNANVTGTLTCDPWNGNTGGILAFMASGTVTLNANVNVNGKGFRGAIAPPGTFNCYSSNYFYPSGSPDGGLKGEGIAQASNSKLLGRGAQANGGGGGNNNNSGGGGGGNFTAGGRGGDQVLYQACTGVPIGGEAGFGLPVASSQNRIFLGGGGGSGHQNDNNNQGIHGMNGGGIIFVSASQLIGNNFTFFSNGFSNTQMPTTDGAGGGGGAGTIVFDVSTYTGTSIINLGGGSGGSINSASFCLGTGGGGSGGVFWHQGASLPANVNTILNGGPSGKQIQPSSSCFQSSWGAVDGQTGAILPNFQYTIPVIPIADAGPDQVICAGDTVQLGGLPQTGLSYSWNQGAGASPNPVVTPAQTTTYVLTVTQGTGCPVSDVDSVTITVQPNPVANFTYTSGCNGLTVNFTNITVNGISYSWNFGDGTTSTATSPQHTFPAAGVYQVQMVATSGSGCTDSLTVPVYATLPQYPQVTITSALTDSCSYSVSFIGDTLNAQGFLWDFGDGTTGNQLNPVHTYTLPGTYTILLTVQNPCGADTANVIVTLDSLIYPNTAFTSDTSFCSPQVEFTNQTQNGTQFTWLFGDGDSSSLANPVHTYAAAGSYNVSLLSYNNCFTDTTILQITIDPFELPEASFQYTTSPCSYGVSFNNTSQNGTRYYWDFGNGTTSVDVEPVYNYYTPGVYQVTLTTTNACGTDSAEITLILQDVILPEAAFSYEPGICTGEIQFTDNSTGALTWLWYFGDGTTDTSQNPVHSYESVGIREVTLIINSGTPCPDTIIQPIETPSNLLTALFIPNAFTPNNDGKNDRFEILLAKQCPGVEITIFNRWGQEIFNSTTQNNTWDGTYDGTPVPDGVYYYTLRFNKNSRSGHVSLMR